MPKTAVANGKTFTFDDNVTDEQIGIAIEEYFNGQTKDIAPVDVKRKENTTPLQKSSVKVVHLLLTYLLQTLSRA